ncbi:DUF935 domain-containing protein [Lonepinella koalarum]|uniref:Phage gp29-like protein n=1 Tax=Lonepinella koalarum TaxID=53417 RepID=A0A4R1KJM0_9PAST|nr:DUF935 family protein [Lonepinella koalarum]MDH2927344.1 hypothetical protein [Lonepinella koalarum]TCK64924.1 phage gp29-like protein [Lonepinella koalarum]TFJ88817.1 DUF935 family protein [Lonepinella koalarum]
MKNKNDLIGVIASRATAADVWAYLHYLPNPDPVLKKMGKDVSAYREILSDSHVGGCVRRRKAAIKGLEWRLTPTGDEKTDEILTAVFERLPLNQIINQLLDAPLFGYQVLEIDWQKDEQGRLIPVNLVGKPQEWFNFDEDNQLMLRTKKDRFGEPVKEKKFLLATHQADYINPYGKADLGLCFWAATFKKGGFKYWLEFVEKYGSPYLLGKHPRQAQIHEIEDLLDSLEQMAGSAVAAIPDDSKIEILQGSDKSGNSQLFDDFLRACKAEISVALLGQDQTTEADSNRASSQSGLEVTRDIRNEDAAIVESAFNQLLAWICEFNFTQLETLPRFELYEQESIDKLQAERDKLLSDMGVQFTEQYLHRTYGFEDGDIMLKSAEQAPDSVKSAVKNGAEFAEKPQSVHPIADGIVEQLEVESQDLIDVWLQDIKDRLLQADSLEDFQSQLDSLIPELTFAEYGQLMALGSVVAELAGRQSVSDENM